MRRGFALREFHISLSKRNQFNTRRLCPVYKNVASFSTCDDRTSFASVPDYYSGKSVFVTGGTGFLGMAIIEKLLYSCSNISNIYVLIRNTDQLNAKDRLRKMLHNPAFSRLKRERKTDLQKIVPISGNVESANLGITHKDEEILRERVSVIFHAAATVEFDRPLIEALRINYEGTQKVIDLCKKIKQLRAFVHISTAYSNTDRKVIEEKVYPPPAKINDVYNCLKRFGDDEDKIKQILNGRPNTYTFTKALAEDLVFKECKNIPTVIIRPSIVGPAIDEPVKGWLNQISAPSMLLLWGSTGSNHVIRGSKSNIADIIPIDYVANLTLVAASVCNRSNELAVYNCSTGSINPLYLGESFKLLIQARVTFTTRDLPFPKVFVVRNRSAVILLSFLTQIIPACVFDLELLLKGKPARYLKQQRKLIMTRDYVEFFTFNTWLFKTDKIVELSRMMTEQDRRLFPFDVSNIKWPQYMIIYANALKTFLKMKC